MTALDELRAKIQRLAPTWTTCSSEFVDDCDHPVCNLERAADEIERLSDEAESARIAKSAALDFMGQAVDRFERAEAALARVEHLLCGEGCEECDEIRALRGDDR